MAKLWSRRHPPRSEHVDSPPERTDEERQVALEWLDYNQRRYRETKNPVYAWEAYLDARHAGVEVPPAVLDYFERCALRVARLTRRQRAFRPDLIDGMTEAQILKALHAQEPVSLDNVPKAVAMATEFVLGGKKGPVNQLRVHFDTAHEMGVAAAVFFKLREGHKEDYAYDQVAAEHPPKCAGDPHCTRISRSTVRRYWKKHAASFK